MFRNTWFPSFLVFWNTKIMTNEKLMENLRNAINQELKDTSMVKFASKCGISYECLRGIVYKKTKSVDSKTLVSIFENSNVKIIEVFEIRDEDVFYSMIKDFYFTDGFSEFILTKIEKT